METLTTSEAAQELNVSQRRVTALIQAGRLPAKMFGPVYMIRRKDLDKVRDRKPGRPVKIEKE